MASTYYVKPWKGNNVKLWCLYEVLVQGEDGICVADSPDKQEMYRYKAWLERGRRHGR